MKVVEHGAAGEERKRMTIENIHGCSQEGHTEEGAGHRVRLMIC